jgi:hypothetical protein
MICVLEMIGEFETIVHVKLTEFLFGRLVSGNVDVRPIGQKLRESFRALLHDRTHGLHRF